MTQKYRVVLDANNGGGRETRITKRKTSHNFFNNVKYLDEQKLLVKDSTTDAELKNLILTLRFLQITSPLNSLIPVWVTNSFFPLQISNIGTLVC